MLLPPGKRAPVSQADQGVIHNGTLRTSVRFHFHVISIGQSISFIILKTQGHLQC